jgi:hypothetical protein
MPNAEIGSTEKALFFKSDAVTLKVNFLRITRVVVTRIGFA